MASIITATTSSGLTQSADNSGVLQLASGTGNLVTVPSVTGTAMVSGNMPAFRARPATASQSVSNNTFTKVTLGTEDFDTNNCFSSSRFTPNVAGYYQLSGSVYCTNSSGNMTQARCNIYKNGSDEVYGGVYLLNATGSNNTDSIATVTGLVYLNGSTDYVELYGFIGGSSVSPSFAGSAIYTVFSGYLARVA
jgi:hypothetical protein